MWSQPLEVIRGSATSEIFRFDSKTKAVLSLVKGLRIRYDAYNVFGVFNNYIEFGSKLTHL